MSDYPRPRIASFGLSCLALGVLVGALSPRMLELGRVQTILALLAATLLALWAYRDVRRDLEVRDGAVREETAEDAAYFTRKLDERERTMGHP
jgi:hypothetical protein